MRSPKKYTNLNFTKRVDHESGNTYDNPLTEPAICKTCQAIFTKGRWTFEKDILNGDPFKKIELFETVCPACRQIETGIPSGFVYLSGSFLDQHLREIKNLIKNEEKKINTTNPLARIMFFGKERKRLIIKTTTVNLAQHFGRVLKNAYGGEVHYDFSHENKLARVYWERES
jgi:NMD protein affecting ribosome stability and mRNA decay